MFRYVFFLLLSPALVHSQTVGKTSQFAGCYELDSITWQPPANNLDVIPKRLELLSASRGDGEFRVRALDVDTRGNENFWWWKPKGENKVRIGLGTGLGGFRGTLKRSKNGDLKGKIKEWCDSRCGWKKRTGTLHLQPISCTP